MWNQTFITGNFKSGKKMSTLFDTEMVDIHEWDAEESLEKREKLKEKMNLLLEKSVTANKGNLGMLKRVLNKHATSPKKYKYCASFVWYSVGQATPLPGEVEYVIKTGWDDRSANWSPLLATAKAPSREVEEAKMDLILGRNRITICQDLDDICRQDIIPFDVDLIKNSRGIKHPKLGVASYKVGQFEVQLSNAGAYNNHMRDIHGVKTEVRDGGSVSYTHLTLPTKRIV